MTGNTEKTKNMKNKKQNKNQKQKRCGVGEPCIAFLEKMPKCQTNKNQKKTKENTFFFRKHIFLENNYFSMYFFHAKMFCYRLLAKDILSEYKN